jgi:hypothetical protein
MMMMTQSIAGAVQEDSYASLLCASQLKDTVFEYRVGEYHLRITFLEENELFWEYLCAPNGQTGKNATEQIERTQIRNDMLLMR